MLDHTSPRPAQLSLERESLTIHAPATQIDRLLTGTSLVVLDLDYLLVIPNGLHRHVFVEAVRSLGGDGDRALNSFIEHRGTPYTRLVRLVYQDCGGAAALRVTEDAFLRNFAAVAQSMRTEKSIGNADPKLTPGADMVVMKVVKSGIPFKVCTGSLRAIAELQIDLVGLGGSLPPETLRCADDTDFEKTDPRYWKELFNGLDSSTILGFEDRIEPAETLLKIGVGQMVICPRKSDEMVEEFRLRYPERVTLVRSLEELWHGAQPG